MIGAAPGLRRLVIRQLELVHSDLNSPTRATVSNMTRKSLTLVNTGIEKVGPNITRTRALLAAEWCRGIDVVEILEKTSRGARFLRVCAN